jgi:hypothetical protein
MKRRSWRETCLLLKETHAPILLNLAIAEMRHKPLKCMANGIAMTVTMAMATPMPTLT